MATPKNTRLPGTEDGGISELERLAEQYVEHGEERKRCKEAIIAEMRRVKKVHYQHGRFEITLTDPATSVRVKVDRDDDDDE